MSARRRLDRIRVGVAGWDYRDWRGVLYPQRPGKGFDPLPFLAGYLDLVEINSTFYGPATEAVASRWAQRVRGAARFRFAAKLWRRFTHERTRAWTAGELDEVRPGLDALAGRDLLDALVLQFPWSFRNSEPAREWLTDLVAAFAEYPLVVEVRHGSWHEPEFYGWLHAQGVGFVNIDQPLFRNSLQPSARATSARGYVRVHGRNYQDWFRRNAGRDARYDYLYPVAELEPWVERTRKLAAHGDVEAVDVVFNNHYRAQAVVNALQFKHLLHGAPVPAPAALVAAYPAELEGRVKVAPPG